MCVKHRGHGLIEFEISNSTISTVFRQPLNHATCSETAFEVLRCTHPLYLDCRNPTSSPGLRRLHLRRVHCPDALSRSESFRLVSWSLAHRCGSIQGSEVVIKARITKTLQPTDIRRSACLPESPAASTLPASL